MGHEKHEKHKKGPVVSFCVSGGRFESGMQEMPFLFPEFQMVFSCGGNGRKRTQRSQSQIFVFYAFSVAILSWPI